MNIDKSIRQILLSECNNILIKLEYISRKFIDRTLY